MFGTLKKERKEGLLRMVTPWEERLFEDLIVLMDKEGIHKFDERLKRGDVKLLWEPEWTMTVLAADTRSVKCYRVESEEGVDRVELEEYTCDICEPDGSACVYKGNVHGMATHKRCHHCQTHPVRGYVHVNCCPLCRRIFSDRNTAAYHVAKALLQCQLVPVKNH